MLLSIKKLVSERKRVSVGEIAIHFDASAETIDAIMQDLEKRGFVKLCSPKTGKCAGCGKCGDATGSVSDRVYEHLGS